MASQTQAFQCLHADIKGEGLVSEVRGDWKKSEEVERGRREGEEWRRGVKEKERN